jgi:multidrug efflux pump subunit AcrA (membrane-fusion protein)
LSASADLYFEAANRDGKLNPGQRVGVELPLRGEREGLVVPAKAILYDIYGGTWVYEKTGEHAFQRQRILVEYTQEDLAILRKGPAAGTEVVVDGAAELYGTEFGSGK